MGSGRVRRFGVGMDSLTVQSRRGLGFTLVEMLLVITIIAIVVSITIPALGGARETSRRIACLANLKSMGTGLQAYMNDSKDLLPRVRPIHDPNGNQNDMSLLDVMVSYLAIPAPEREDPTNPNSPWIHVADVLKCPSDRVGKDAATNFEPLWRSSGFSYEYLAGEMMVFAEQMTVVDPQKGTTLLYNDPKWRDLPVVLDNDDWHTGRKGGVPRNAVFFGDWRADWASNIVRFDSQDPRLRQLVCDLIVTYGQRVFPGCN